MGRVMRRRHGAGKEVQGPGTERSYGKTTRVSGERNAEKEQNGVRGMKRSDEEITVGIGRVAGI